MLILTRKPGEQLIIGDNITVEVLGVKGNQVRIGIDAPKDINIVRNELLEHQSEDDYPAKVVNS